MKKSILTTAVLFIGLAAFAQDNGKCTKKCNAGYQKAAAKATAADKKNGSNEWMYGLKCSSHNAACQDDGKKTGGKQVAKAKAAK